MKREMKRNGEMSWRDLKKMIEGECMFRAKKKMIA